MPQSATVNRRFVMAERPLGRPLKDSDFRYEEGPVPTPGPGEILVRSLYFSFDPAQKGWMESIANYVAPMAVGDVIRSFCVGQIVASNATDFAPGDFVAGNWGWQDYAVLKGIADPLVLDKLPRDRPPSYALSALGVTSLTAYFGLFDLGKPMPGETVVVSGAAGATGSAAGQMAKLAGCRVVGIAGGPEKCDWLTRELGFDGAIDYKAGPIGPALAELCPDGIHVFYDNVGGTILNECLAKLAMKARVIVCGGISRYETGQTPVGPGNYFNLIFMRARMEGLIVLDYAPRFAEAKRRIWQWIEAGKLKFREDVVEGFEHAPETLQRLFAGKNLGKQILKVADPV